MPDMLRTIEAELAGHPVFGDTQGILDRRRAFALLYLGRFRNRPFIRALCRELHHGRHRRAAADVFADPAVQFGIRDLLGATPRGGECRLHEPEELFAAVLRHLRDGTPGLPTAAGCPLRVRPRGASHDIALWDPDAPSSVFKRRFESALYSRNRRRFRRPCPVFAEAVERGCDLLATLLPGLGASALAHLRLIGVFRGEDAGSSTNTRLASTSFLSVAQMRTPWETAEALLHEALHCKLGALVHTRNVWRKDGGTEGIRSLVIRPVWRRNQSGGREEWPPNRAFGAFHVYVHLALFFVRVERLEALPAGGFGAPPASFREGLRTALDRAGWLGRALDAAGLPFGADGRALFAWLSRTLQRLSDTAGADPKDPDRI